MELSHLEMTEAIADLAIGVCRVARWTEGGRVHEAVATSYGIVVRVFDRRGVCIDVRTMPKAEAASYVAHARRSAA